MSDQSRNAPGPNTSARHLDRTQALAKRLKDVDPEQALNFETLSAVIQNKAAARTTDWVLWVGPPELGVVMLYGHKRCDC